MGGPRVPNVAPEYRLAVGDKISMVLPTQMDFSTEAVVRPDGKVTFPFVGDVMAAGYTPSELDSMVTVGLREVVIEPDIAIIVTRYTDQLVYVLGEVQNPGAYEIMHGMTTTQAISQAGGPSNMAKLTDVVLVRRVTPYEAKGTKLDIERFLEEGDFQQDAQLQAYDIVYIPRTKIGTMSTWLDTFFKGWTHPLTLIVRGYELIVLLE